MGVQESGSVATHSYGAYGNRTPNVRDALAGYAGQVVESDLGAYLLGHRLYLPALRRFANADPLSPFDAGGPNRYAYCAGDPINRVDPTGNVWKALFGMIADGTSDLPPDIGRLGSVTPAIARQVTQATVEAFSRGADKRVTTLDEAWRAGGKKTTVAHRGGDVFIHSGPEWQQARTRGTSWGIGSPSAGLVNREYKPEWLKFSNARGKDVYLPDAVVTMGQTFNKVRSYLREQGASDARDVVVLAGAHGNALGLNWDEAGKWRRASDIGADRALRYSLMLGGRIELRGLAIKDVGSMTREHFRAVLDGDRTVFGGICFLAADEMAMQVLNYDSVNTFVMKRR